MVGALRFEADADAVRRSSARRALGFASDGLRLKVRPDGKGGRGVARGGPGLPRGPPLLRRGALVGGGQGARRGRAARDGQGARPGAGAVPRRDGQGLPARVGQLQQVHARDRGAGLEPAHAAEQRPPGRDPRARRRPRQRRGEGGVRARGQGAEGRRQVHLRLAQHVGREGEGVLVADAPADLRHAPVPAQGQDRRHVLDLRLLRCEGLLGG
mmetsp:Transcript_57056/g.173728  ORF Transcript_57056/g.173728 Transcript_57056/m.173728 type:complete len:213 (+) Transcript_57056:354-992(+)